MAKLNFTGIEPFKPKVRVSVTGPHFRRRVAFFSRFMPKQAARRIAGSWNISKGARHYNPNIMDGLKILDEQLKLNMRLRGVSRDKAIQNVWSNLKIAFEREGRSIETSGELLHWWISDNVS